MLKPWYIEEPSGGRWMIVNAMNLNHAKQAGTKEWGRRPSVARRPTQKELDYYVETKGEIDEAP